MPGQKHQRVSEPAPKTVSPAPAVAEDPESLRGNQALTEEKLGAGASEGPGRLTWEGALGSTVGGKLYGLLADQLTQDKLLGHANKAVDAAMSFLKGQMSGIDDPASVDMAGLFTQHLDTQLRAMASKAVIDTNASQELTDLVGGNPYAVALAALGGAAAYVLSNQDIPMIEQKLGLGGGFALLAGVDVGRTMALSVEQVRAGLRYSGGGAEVTVKGDAFKDGGYQLTGQYDQTFGPGERLSLSGQQISRPGEDRSRVDLGYANPNLTAGAYWERLRKGEGKEVDSVGGSLSYKESGDEGLQAYLRGRVSSDKSWEAAGGLTKQNKNGSMSLEGFAGQDPLGKTDYGVRALFRWSF